MRHRFAALLITILLLSYCGASAQQSAQWTDTGITGLSVRFVQESPTQCTWTFRNDGVHTLTALDFKVDDFNAAKRMPEHSTNSISSKLLSGEETEGPSSFSAEANCRSVKLWVTNIQWK
jgi:hypothetical protein